MLEQPLAIARPAVSGASQSASSSVGGGPFRRCAQRACPARRCRARSRVHSALIRPVLRRDTGRAMSQENVEVVKAFMGLFEAGDRDAWRDYFDPDVVWDTSASEMPAGGIYHGHEGIERFFREWLGAWDQYEVETREYIDAGDSVVLVFRQSGIGRGSGVTPARCWYPPW
jgi:ketosteroid isomerase-like protein